MSAREKFGGHLAVVLEASPECRGAGPGSGIHHAAQFHAVVHRVDGDRNVVGVEDGLQGDEDLTCQPLLDLRTLAEEAHDAIQLGQADDAVAGSELADVVERLAVGRAVPGQGGVALLAGEGGLPERLVWNRRLGQA